MFLSYEPKLGSKTTESIAHILKQTGKQSCTKKDEEDKQMPQEPLVVMGDVFLLHSKTYCVVWAQETMADRRPDC